MSKVCIAGSRNWNNYEELKEMMEVVREEVNITTIVSGTALGGDKLGERWAKENNIPVEQYPANWVLHGKSAGYKRNEIMADIADVLVIGIKNKSKGSTHMYNIMDKMGKPIYLRRV